MMKNTLCFLLSFWLLLWELGGLLRFLDPFGMLLTLCFHGPEEGTRCSGCEHPSAGDWPGRKRPGQSPEEHLLALHSLLFSDPVQVAERLFRFSYYEKSVSAMVSHDSELYFGVAIIFTDLRL